MANKIKILDNDVAKFYGITRQTLINWKKTEKGLLRYKALKYYYSLCFMMFSIDNNNK